MGRVFWSVMFGFCSLMLALSSYAVDLTTGNLTLVDSKRVGRTDFEYTYQVELISTGAGYEDISATIVSFSAQTAIIDGALDFPDISAGGSVQSTDTFTFRHNRRFPFSFDVFNFDFQATEVSATDVTPPEVSILAPLDGSTSLDSSIQVTVLATDDVALNSVSVNGIPASLTGSDYIAIVPLVLGQNVLNATATDTSGNSSSASVVVNRNQDQPPFVTITSPSDGTLFNSSPITVQGTAGDDVGVVSVKINDVDVPLSSGLFSALVDLVDGINTLNVLATDTFGNTTSISINVTLASPDNTPPDIAILSPLNGAEVTESTISVSGIATDNNVIDNVTVNGLAATLSGDSFAVDVNLNPGSNILTAIATDLSGNINAAVITITLLTDDITPPIVSILTPQDGDSVAESPYIIGGSAFDEESLDSVLVNGVLADINGNSFSASIPLVAGNNAIVAVARDAAGNQSTDSINLIFDPLIVDETPPEVSILAPQNGVLLIEPRPIVQVQATDDAALDTSTLQLLLNNQPLSASCIFDLNIADCTLNEDLPNGSSTLRVSITDDTGNTGFAELDFIVDTIPVTVNITAPQNNLITMQSQVLVEGTVSDGVDAIKVNGVTASMSGNSFFATLNLREGKNMLVAVASRPSGKTGTNFVDVTRDIIAPIVSIDSPTNGFVSVNNTLAVVGKVNDIVSGATEATVRINGINATVAGGGYMVMNVPLVAGQNTITATATDAVGNIGTRSIVVTFKKPVGARMSEGSGNGQSAIVNMMLGEPLVAVVLDGLGNPVAGRIVTFEVTRNSGLLQVNGGQLRRSVQVPTNGKGEVSAKFFLGDTAGEGNNRVRASAVGVAGEVQFCATAKGAAAERILMVMGDNQRGLVGFPLVNPLEALVVDIDGNPLRGIDVTFEVVTGTGNLGGSSNQVQTTGADGIARTVMTLGLNPGVNNNVVNATFAGQTGLPASFVSSGLTQGDPAKTTFSGVVMDNSFTPIPGAVVDISGTSSSDITDDQGQFLLLNVPVGNIHLQIDPTGSPRPETFPPLEFETVAIAGQKNELGQPILLPALQTESSRLVGGDEDVTLFMPGVAGLELTIFANSVTCGDGSSECQVSISQVHLDKVPMPPPSGTFFMPPAWTVQPAGTLFNPPAKISIPNDGLAPGRVIDIFQFDHTLNEFINIGKGTVTDDGLVIVSDPGFGITRAGWGGCGQPQPPTNCPKNNKDPFRDKDVRDGLEDAWKASKPGNMPDANRKEQGGWIIRKPDGSYEIENWPSGTSASLSVPSTRPAGLAGSFHTHPNTGPGWKAEPSMADINFVKNNPEVAPHYVISEKKIFRINKDGSVDDLGPRKPPKPSEPPPGCK